MSDDESKYEEDEFPHPFVDRSYNMEEPSGTWAPRAVSGQDFTPRIYTYRSCLYVHRHLQILELKMYQLSATLREKSEWWRKAKDPEIRKKWFDEAKAQQENEEEKRWRLSDKMVRWTVWGGPSGKLEGEDTSLRSNSTDKVHARRIGGLCPATG